MTKEALERCNELDKRIQETDDFIIRYKNTWKRGILKRIGSKLIASYRGHGYFGSTELECDKELSEMIYQALLEYQKKIRNEFEEMKGE